MPTHGEDAPPGRRRHRPRLAAVVRVGARRTLPALRPVPGPPTRDADPATGDPQPTHARGPQRPAEGRQVARCVGRGRGVTVREGYRAVEESVSWLCLTSLATTFVAISISVSVVHARLAAAISEIRHRASSGRQGDIANDIFIDWAEQELPGMSSIELTDNFRDLRFTSDKSTDMPGQELKLPTMSPSLLRLGPVKPAE